MMTEYVGSLGDVAVTGGAGGIGRAIAEEAARSGTSRIWLLDLVKSPLVETADAVADEFGCPVEARAVDVASRPSLNELGQEWDRVGYPDLLVNCAGVRGIHTVHETPDEEWDTTIEVNLTGTFNVLRLVSRGWIAEGKAGVAVNIASIASTVGFSHRAAYSASKAGVLGLTKASALDLAAYGIRVMAVSPGLIQTAMSSPGDDAFVAATVPLGRRGSPQELARLVLAVAGSEFVTGTNIVADGGLVAGYRLEG